MGVLNIHSLTVSYHAPKAGWPDRIQPLGGSYFITCLTYIGIQMKAIVLLIIALVYIRVAPTGGQTLCVSHIHSSVFSFEQSPQTAI